MERMDIADIGGASFPVALHDPAARTKNAEGTQVVPASTVIRFLYRKVLIL